MENSQKVLSAEDRKHAEIRHRWTFTRACHYRSLRTSLIWGSRRPCRARTARLAHCFVAHARHSAAIGANGVQEFPSMVLNGARASRPKYAGFA